MRVAILISSAVLLAACRHDSPRVDAAPAPPVAVQVAVAALQEWPEVYEATGTVRARSEAAISSRIMAYVQQVHVALGERVRQGQLLATLDARDLEANYRRAEAGRAEAQSGIPEADHAVAAAQAQLELAQATFRRMADLSKKNSISQQEFDEASARLKAAEASYEMARAKRAQLDARIAQASEERAAAGVMRDYARIAAPFAGVVTLKSVEPGNLAAPGAPLFTIEREGAYRLEAAVDESKLAAIRVGQDVEVALENCSSRARVAEIVPAVDAASRSYAVKIDLPANCAGVRSGMFGRALFSLGKRQAVAVPAGAVIERGQLQTVYVIENGAAHARIITAGQRTAASIEVLSGLNAGEQIAAPVPPKLNDGGRVEVRP
jgi:RND family efflux transporter MFP subunit